ncbi:MAG: hypothetical protein IT373_10655 [Polyangiaceae bacterium]|nr:hypothetical protein [Polyangiaceae bacterium]
MTTLHVQPGGALGGLVPAPVSEPLLSLALVLASLAGGTSSLRTGRSAPVPGALLVSLGALGSAISSNEHGFRVEGAAGRLCAPPGGRVDAGSPTGLAALAGALAGQPFPVVLGRRPADAPTPSEGVVLARMAALLRARGARVEGVLDPASPRTVGLPLSLAPGELGPLAWELPYGGSAGPKVAALLSGLRAAGPTRLHEVLVADDRAERLLVAAGAAIRAAGGMLELEPLAPRQRLAPLDVTLPGDLELVAFLLAAGMLAARRVPGDGGSFGVRNVGWTPARAGVLEVLRDAGVPLESAARAEVLGANVGDVRLAPVEPPGLVVAGERALRCEGALGALVAVTAGARQPSCLADAPELAGADGAVRAGRYVALLAAFGLEARVVPGGLEVGAGPKERWRGAGFDAAGDPDLAMTATALALGADGPSAIHGAEGVAAVFPRFVACLRGLGARIEVRAGPGRRA